MSGYLDKFKDLDKEYERVVDAINTLRDNFDIEEDRNDDIFYRESNLFVEKDNAYLAGGAIFQHAIFLYVVTESELTPESAVREITTGTYDLITRNAWCIEIGDCLLVAFAEKVKDTATGYLLKIGVRAYLAPSNYPDTIKDTVKINGQVVPQFVLNATRITDFDLLKIKLAKGNF